MFTPYLFLVELGDGQDIDHRRWQIFSSCVFSTFQNLLRRQMRCRLSNTAAEYGVQIVPNGYEPPDEFKAPSDQPSLYEFETDPWFHYLCRTWAHPIRSSFYFWSLLPVLCNRGLVSRLEVLFGYSHQLHFFNCGFLFSRPKGICVQRSCFFFFFLLFFLSSI